MTKNAVLIGATGEIGRNILNVILNKNYYNKIYILGRNSINSIPDNIHISKILIDFENLKFDTNILENADIFCSLGAGHSMQFEKTDYEYVVKFAKLCDNKVNSFNLVSSMVVNKNSKFSYARAKGKTEYELSNLNLNKLRIYRPSMLIAPKREKILKIEKIIMTLFKIFDSFFVWKLKNFRGIKPYDLANSMVENAIKNNESGIFKYENIIKQKH